MAKMCGKKVSRKFRNLGTDSDGYWGCIGSPADIRKVITIVENSGVIPLHSDPVIMREGRQYLLMVDPSDCFWMVYRVV